MLCYPDKSQMGLILTPSIFHEQKIIIMSCLFQNGINYVSDINIYTHTSIQQELAFLVQHINVLIPWQIQVCWLWKLGFAGYTWLLYRYESDIPVVSHHLTLGTKGTKHISYNGSLKSSVAPIFYPLKEQQVLTWL